MMFEEVAPASTETPLHTHDDSDEIAYVLSGQITFKIGDEITVGGPGTCAFMPRGLAHAWKNTGAEPGRVLFLYSPGRAGKFFEEAAAMGRPFSVSDHEIVAAGEPYGWQIVATFADHRSGAKGRDKRPGLDAMMNAATKREFDMVAAWSIRDWLNSAGAGGASTAAATATASEPASEVSAWS